MSPLSELLQNHAGFAPVIRSHRPYRTLDLSETNEKLMEMNLSDTSVFTRYVFDELLSHSTFLGIGGYNEHRVIYRQLDHFEKQAQNPRCIHLGVDIWAPTGEPIYAPLNGFVHSFAFNDSLGDYGPTIILEHHLAGITFYTLYGHLTISSLDGLFENKKIQEGEKIAEIGTYPENGDWPPHLHFQVIEHLENLKGDFPGVCSMADREIYTSACPDPNLMLRIPELG